VRGIEVNTAREVVETDVIVVVMVVVIDCVSVMVDVLIATGTFEVVVTTGGEVSVVHTVVAFPFPYTTPSITIKHKIVNFIVCNKSVI
jgi:hypothetical protein